MTDEEKLMEKISYLEEQSKKQQEEIEKLKRKTKKHKGFILSLLFDR